MSTKAHIQGNVTFVRFQAGNLWYRCADGFEFPVPVSDTGEATFLAQDKGIFFMRWIRQHVALLAEGLPI